MTEELYHRLHAQVREGFRRHARRRVAPAPEEGWNIQKKDGTLKRLVALLAPVLAWVGLAASAIAAAPSAASATASSAPADAIYLDARVLTLDAQDRDAEAFAVRDGRFAAIGRARDVRRLQGPRTTVHRLRGATVLPGFIDAHGHFPISAFLRREAVDLNSPPIGTIHSLDELVAALAAREKTLPQGAWLSGFGYDDTLLVEHRHPTRADLDRVSSTRPIYLSHVSGHLAVANSAALALAGIGRDTQPPAGGRIRRDAGGEPDGVLEETAMQLVSAKLPQPTDAQMEAAIEEASREYASRGVTTAQNGATDASFVAQAARVLAHGGLGVRVDVWLVVPVAQALGPEKIAALVPPAARSMLEVTGVKAFADGSIQGHTAYLSAPYHTHLQAVPGYRGYPRVDREALAAQVLTLQRARIRVAIHANGDAAIDDVLDAFERAQAADPWPDARHVVVHAQMARDDQLDRMARLGVVPSFFVLHTYYWGDRHRDLFIGPERAARISPARSALERGIPFTLHADAPVVPMDPLLMVWAAVNRVTSSGQVLGAPQRVSPKNALRGVTINAARQEHQEATRGSIETGKYADFVVLAEDPLRVEPMKIRDIRVLETVVGGRTVFRAAP